MRALTENEFFAIQDALNALDEQLIEDIRHEDNMDTRTGYLLQLDILGQMRRRFESEYEKQHYQEAS